MVQLGIMMIVSNVLNFVRNVQIAIIPVRSVKQRLMKVLLEKAIMARVYFVVINVLTVKKMALAVQLVMKIMKGKKLL